MAHKAMWPSQQLKKKIIRIKHINIFKNINWPEANQLAYKRGWQGI